MDGINMIEAIEKKETASEVVIKALEDFGISEPETVLILFTNEAGNICCRSNTDSTCMKVGMLRYAERILLNGQD